MRWMKHSPLKVWVQHPHDGALLDGPSRRVAPQGLRVNASAGRVTRLVDVPISTAPRALLPIDSDSNGIRADYAEAPKGTERDLSSLDEDRH